MFDRAIAFITRSVPVSNCTVGKKAFELFEKKKKKKKRMTTVKGKKDRKQGVETKVRRKQEVKGKRQERDADPRSRIY